MIRDSGRFEEMLKVFADLAAFEIGREQQATKATDEKRERIRTVIDEHKLVIVYQPIWKLGNDRPVGFECLSRFMAEPQRPPNTGQPAPSPGQRYPLCIEKWRLNCGNESSPQYPPQL